MGLLAKQSSPRTLVADCQTQCADLLTLLHAKPDASEPSLGLFAAKLYLYLGEIKLAKLESFALILGKLEQVLQKAAAFIRAWSQQQFANAFFSDPRNAQELATTFLSLDCCLQGLVLSTTNLQPRPGQPKEVAANPRMAAQLISSSLRALSLWFDHYDRIIDELDCLSDLPVTQPNHLMQTDHLLAESWSVVHKQALAMGVQPEQMLPASPADTAWQSALFGPAQVPDAMAGSNAGEKRLAVLASFDQRQDRMGDISAALPFQDQTGHARDGQPNPNRGVHVRPNPADGLHSGVDGKLDGTQQQELKLGIKEQQQIRAWQQQLQRQQQQRQMLAESVYSQGDDVNFDPNEEEEAYPSRKMRRKSIHASRASFVRQRFFNDEASIEYLPTHPSFDADDANLQAGPLPSVSLDESMTGAVAPQLYDTLKKQAQLMLPVRVPSMSASSSVHSYTDSTVSQAVRPPRGGGGLFACFKKKR